MTPLNRPPMTTSSRNVGFSHILANGVRQTAAKKSIASPVSLSARLRRRQTEIDGLSVAENNSAARNIPARNRPPVGNRAAARNSCSRGAAPRERSEWRGDDCRGGNDYGARHADGPGQWRRRVGGIVLRFGGRERQSGEPGGDRYRNRNSADTHGSPGLGLCAKTSEFCPTREGRSPPGLARVS